MSSKRYIENTGFKLPVRILTIVFGAIPATVFSYYAVLVVIVGASAFASGGIVFVAFGVAGIFGTVSLWTIAFGKDSKVFIVGLIAGSLAMLLPLSAPSSIVPDMPGVNGRAVTTFLEASPIVVALCWLGYFFLRSGAREISESRISQRHN